MPDEPECVPGVRCDRVATCTLAKHHLGDCNPDGKPCEACGAQPWEECRPRALTVPVAAP